MRSKTASYIVAMEHKDSTATPAATASVMCRLGDTRQLDYEQCPSIEADSINDTLPSSLATLLPLRLT